MSAAQWRTLVDHVMSIPERVYETWVSGTGWNNVTEFGAEYGWNGVPWCAIFDWDMYHDVGLDAIVPKTASVAELASWAREHGRWSEYPSAGALTVFGGSAHTEIVIGFDATTVYTKGGNSVKAGATDDGQGNGVWSHAHERRAPYVTGYLAPRYPDGICPPTADPDDARGGRATASWRWTGPASAPSVSLAHVVEAARTDPGAAQGHVTHRTDVLPVEKGLQAEGLLAARWVDGSFGTETVAAYASWQRRLGYTGPAADGIPGDTSLKSLGARHGFTVTA